MDQAFKIAFLFLAVFNQAGLSWAQKDSIFRKYAVIDPSGKDSIVTSSIDDDHLRFKNNYRYYTGNNIPNSGEGLVFDFPVELTKDTFDGRLDIRKARFKDDVSFDSVLFSKNTDFTYSFFEQDARFEYCRFLDSVHFCMVYFLGDADFSNAIFGRIAYFSGLFYGPQTSLSFTLATLPDTLDLSENIVIPQLIELTDAQFTEGKIHYIFLNRTNISMIHFDYRHFRLLFFDPQKRNMISEEERRSIYEQVLQNFKARGQQDSYQAVDIEYHHFLAKNPLERIVDKIQQLWWNYGYWKWLVIVWAVGFIILFSTFNYFRLNDLNKNVYPIEGIPLFPTLGVLPFSWRRARNRYWFSMVYTSTIFFRLTLEVKGIQFKRVFAAFYIFIIYLLGILCLAYMANFVLQK